MRAFLFACHIPFMKQHVPVQVSIPKPCHESWDAMQPVTDGRHCRQCQKVVTDFTKMSDAQIIAFLQREPFGCGRFREDQVDRELILPARKVPFAMKWAAGLLLLLGWAKEGLAQSKPKAPHKTHQSPAKPQPKTVKGGSRPIKHPQVQTDSISIDPREPVIKQGGMSSNIESDNFIGKSVYQSGDGHGLNVTGARVAATTYIIDGVQYAPSPVSTTQRRSFWRRMQFWRK